MTVEQIRETIHNYKKQGLKLFISSSFQSHSIPLLHIISTIDKTIPVMFIHTGYHFPETLQFKDKIIDLLGLPLVNVYPKVSKLHQKDCEGNLLFTSDPDYCCYLNKTQPMETVLAEYDIWINGIRADQSSNRSEMQIEQDAGFGCKRFHPVLDWDSKMILDYQKEYSLPRHPLEEKGYFSIGCEPCTRKPDLNDERSGRWFGMKKTECGLHLDLVKK
jgi:phosphoadenosine phosphosulfate reductase